MFAVTKVKGPTIIVKGKRDGKIFARNISMVKKYKHISDLDDYSDIDSSGSAEMNTENTHPDNRGSNMDSFENVDKTKCKQRSSFIPYMKSPDSIWQSMHWKKKYEGGEKMWYMQWTMDGLCIYGLFIWTLYMNLLYTLDEAFFL